MITTDCSTWKSWNSWRVHNYWKIQCKKCKIMQVKLYISLLNVSCELFKLFKCRTCWDMTIGEPRWSVSVPGKYHGRPEMHVKMQLRMRPMQRWKKYIFYDITKCSFSCKHQIFSWTWLKTVRSHKITLPPCWKVVSYCSVFNRRVFKKSFGQIAKHIFTQLHISSVDWPRAATNSY